MLSHVAPITGLTLYSPLQPETSFVNRHDTSGKFGIIFLKYDASCPVLLPETPSHTWKPQFLFCSQSKLCCSASSMMNHDKIKYKSKDVEHRPSLNWKYEKGGHQPPERQYKYDLKSKLKGQKINPKLMWKRIEVI